LKIQLENLSIKKKNLKSLVKELEDRIEQLNLDQQDEFRKAYFEKLSQFSSILSQKDELINRMIKEQEDHNFEMFQLKRDKNDLISELKELQEEKMTDLESQISLLNDQLNTAYRQLSEEKRQNELQNESNVKHLKMEMEIQ
jgi:hypothetical protein